MLRLRSDLFISSFECQVVNYLYPKSKKRAVVYDKQTEQNNFLSKSQLIHT